MTAIEWTDETWNPTVGCSRVSPGCDNCYAIGVAHRGLQPAHEGLTIKRKGEGTDWTGEVRLLPDRLDTPLRWRKPRRVFVDSMSDLFHPDVPEWFINEVLTTMLRARQHTFQVLTKRPQRMRGFLSDLWDGAPQAMAATDDPLTHEAIRHLFTPYPNVWLGTSIESDRYAFRADHLRETPAAVRFLSLEPLLGPLPSLDLTGIDWVIVGGESGPGARPMHPDWVTDIRDRCLATQGYCDDGLGDDCCPPQGHSGTRFFFKQWGAWGPIAPLKDGRYDMSGSHAVANDGTIYYPGDLAWPDGPRRREAIREGHNRAHLTGMYRLGKKATGRELDGRTWDQMPQAVTT